VNHLLFYFLVFACTFVALQLFVLLAAFVVRVAFPEWESANERLRLVNALSIKYAVAAVRLVHKYLFWAFVAVFALLTLVYS
jgi:hypothetical protein